MNGNKETKKRRERRARKQLATLSLGPVSGNGDYVSDAIKSAKARISAFATGQLNRMARPGQMVGGQSTTPFADVGGIVGKRYGSNRLGRAAGNLVGSFFGHGDYTLSANSLMKDLHVTGPTSGKIKMDKKGVLRLIDSECLGDVLSAGINTFNNVSYPINPGLSSSFPWLSQVASLFDQYQMNGLVFEFRSTSSEYNSVGQALGTVVMATDYDVTDAPYPTKAQMENSDFACSAKTSSDLIHGVECAPSTRPTNIMYVRTGSSPPNTDLHLYDLGNFQFATAGLSSSTVTVGELWVHYDVTLMKKQINPNQGGQSAFILSGGTIAAATPFGTLPTLTSFMNVSVSSASTLTFGSIGQYLITATIVGTTVTATGPALGGTCTAQAVSNGNIGNGSTKATYLVMVNVDAPGETLTLSYAGTCATMTSGWHRIAQYNYSLPVL